MSIINLKRFRTIPTKKKVNAYRNFQPLFDQTPFHPHPFLTQILISPLPKIYPFPLENNSTLILLLPTRALPHFTLNHIPPLFVNYEYYIIVFDISFEYHIMLSNIILYIQTRIAPKLQFPWFSLCRPKTQFQLDQNLSYEFEQHCGSCAGPPELGHCSRGIQELPFEEAQNEWYLTSKTSSAFAWSRANCASHSQSARSHVFASSRHFSSPLF